MNFKKRVLEENDGNLDDPSSNGEEQKKKKIATTTIQDVPSEVLTCIFSFLSKKKLLHHISFVCKRWREVICNMKHPWKSISMDDVDVRKIGCASDLLDHIIPLSYFRKHLECLILDWDDYSLKRDDIARLENFPNLQKLHAESWCNLNRETFEKLTNGCPELEYVVLVCTSADENTAGDIEKGSLRLIAEKLKNLHTFGFREFLTRNDEYELIIKTQGAKLVDITLPIQANDHHLQLIADNCPNLRAIRTQSSGDRLLLSGNHDAITSNGVISFVKSCTELEDFDDYHAGSFLIFHSTHIPEIVGLNDEAIAALVQHCHKLTKISICLQHVTNTGLRMLESIAPQLTHFRLFKVDSGIVTEDALKSLISRCYNLESLVLEAVTDQSDVINAIGATCHKLVELTVSSGDLDPYDFDSIVSNCKHLRAVKLFQCTEPDGWLKYFPDRGCTLQKLSIVEASLGPAGDDGATEWQLFATDESIEYFFSKCKSLQAFSIDANPTPHERITDKSLQAIMEHAPHLKELELINCMVTESALIEFANQMPQLRLLNVQGPLISSAGRSCIPLPAFK